MFQWMMRSSASREGSEVCKWTIRPLGGRAAFGNPGLDSRPQPMGHVRGLFGGIRVV